MSISLIEGAVRASAILEVEREDINWKPIDPGTTLIEIVVHNRGEGRSEPTSMEVQTAPLGVFVPWQPLTSVMVPPIDPGDRQTVTTLAFRPGVQPQAAPAQVSPRQLLDAFRGSRRMRREPMSWFISRRLLLTGARGWLASDLFELHGRKNVYWAGNLNVFIGGDAVERHLAQALRIYPNCLNMAMFVVGQGPDAYAFSTSADGLHDGVRLELRSSKRSVDMYDYQIGPREHQWVSCSHTMMMELLIDVPEYVEAGSVNVHVLQRSTGKEGLVEFSLDPDAEGPGCFVV